MRPSHPVRHRWPLRNHRFFCSRFRAALWRSDWECRHVSHPRLSPRLRSWRSRSGHRQRPGAACVPASLDATRWPGSASPYRWAVARKLHIEAVSKHLGKGLKSIGRSESKGFPTRALRWSLHVDREHPIRARPGRPALSQSRTRRSRSQTERRGNGQPERQDHRSRRSAWL